MHGLEMGTIMMGSWLVALSAYDRLLVQTGFVPAQHPHSASFSFRLCILIYNQSVWYIPMERKYLDRFRMFADPRARSSPSNSPRY